MRWPVPFRRRRDVYAELALNADRPKVWAEIAMPPPLEPQGWSPTIEPVIETFAPTLAGTRSTVRLGFADGTSVEVDSSSAESDAFRDTATRLLEAYDPRKS